MSVKDIGKEVSGLMWFGIGETERIKGATTVKIRSIAPDANSTLEIIVNVGF